MNFFTVQSLNTYTKNMEMQMKWQKKKETGDFTADSSTKLDAVSRQAEEIRKANADGSKKMSSQIDLKLNSGQKLTAEEMEYLQKHDPQKYQKVKQIEAEQESYERELKRCKTKDEVQRVKMVHTAASFSAVNSIKNNPVIPEEKKLELIMQEHRKNMAIEETTRAFVESGKYAKLPTEEERLKAEKDLKEAEEAELRPEEKPEDAETAEKKEDDAGDAQEILDAGAETLRQAEAEAAKREARSVMEEREMTRAEAENSPEAMKVKRAKAQAAYKMNRPEVQTVKGLDVKVE
ncbi:MAG: hypothetical protein K1W34_18555 [Lachnospiraceae bacterium]